MFTFLLEKLHDSRFQITCTFISAKNRKTKGVSVNPGNLLKCLLHCLPSNVWRQCNDSWKYFRLLDNRFLFICFFSLFSIFPTMLVSFNRSRIGPGAVRLEKRGALIMLVSILKVYQKLSIRPRRLVREHFWFCCWNQYVIL